MDLSKIEITQGNIRLRPINIDDKDDIFREFTDEIVKYMYPPVPKDIDETIDFIESSIAAMEAGFNVQMTIEDSGTGEFLGCAGLHRIDLEIPEFGIWLKKGAHGKGIGRKSIKMLFDFACENFGHKFYKYPVDRRNIPSRKIPESLGGYEACYETHERPVGEPLDIVVYHIEARKSGD
ncbi:MAG: GNAT family N-acetyltransferase [Clostridia bacterium]|nr:GNAT family N-acetyltransferase [Clostridia bacterium]